MNSVVFGKTVRALVAIDWKHFFYAPEGEAQRLVGLSRDITQTKQAEQALQQLETELKEAQRIAKVGSWKWDPETDTVTWSEELYRIAGLDQHALRYVQGSREDYTPRVGNGCRL